MSNFAEVALPIGEMLDFLSLHENNRVENWTHPYKADCHRDVDWVFFPDHHRGQAMYLARYYTRRIWCLKHHMKHQLGETEEIDSDVVKIAHHVHNWEVMVEQKPTHSAQVGHQWHRKHGWEKSIRHSPSFEVATPFVRKFHGVPEPP